VHALLVFHVEVAHRLAVLVEDPEAQVRGLPESLLGGSALSFHWTRTIRDPSRRADAAPRVSAAARRNARALMRD
jgi:hypothetical protein